MKHFTYIFFILLFSQACQQNKTKTNEITSDLISNPISASGIKSTNNLPEVLLNKTEHDFGILLQGEKVAYTFILKNIGGSDLIIQDAKASCGCTVPTFSKKPIPPGQEGEVEVIFNSAGRTGRQVKNLTIWTNCQPNTHKLKIMSEIIVPNK